MHASTKDTQIYNALRAQILQSTYRPGVRLIEEDICRQFSATRTPVRHALRRLEQEGLVIAEPYCGCRVREITLPEVQAFDIREMLESLACRYFALTGTDFEIGKLLTMAEAVDSAAIELRWADYFDLDRKFHERIVHKSGNEKLIEILEVFSFQLRSFALYDRYLLDVVAKIGTQEPHRHMAIVNAIKQRDPELAERVMRDHIVSAKAIVLGAVSKR